MRAFSPLSFCLFAASELLAAEKIQSTVSPESKVWRDFRDETQQGKASKLPDFSRAGYQRGEICIPRVEGPIFNVQEYGAIPDDHKSDESAIKFAVAAAENAGGGVVFFPIGTYLLWTNRGQADPIRVKSSRIVFRGEGDSEGGTILHFIHHGLTAGEYAVPKLSAEFNSLRSLLHFGPPPEPVAGDSQTKTPITADVPNGGSVLPVKDGSGFAPGQWIVVGMKSKAALTTFLEHQTPFSGWTKLSEGLSLTSLHQVDSISNGRLGLRDPIYLPLQAADHPIATSTGMIEEVGVEDLCFRGNWYGRFHHHQTALDDEAWDAIRFENVANGWIRRCSFLNVNTAVFLKNSTYCSVLENRVAGTRGHYGITARSGSCGILSGLSSDLAGQAHGPSVGNQSSNIVLWRWSMLPGASFDSHGNMPSRTLVDRVDGGTFMKSGGPESALPNHLTGLVFWNFKYDGWDKQPIDFWSGSRSQSNFVKPWLVGLHGKPVQFVSENLHVNESLGQIVAPESLFEAQLEQRLQRKPGWIESVKNDWLVHKTQPLPVHSLRGHWLATDKNSQYIEVIILKELLLDVATWFASFEKTTPIEIQVPDTAASIFSDWTLLHTLLQNAVFALGDTKTIEVSTVGSNAERPNAIQLRSTSFVAPTKKINVADQEVTDAWIEAQKLAEFIDAHVTINESRDVVTIGLPNRTPGGARLR